MSGHKGTCNCGRHEESVGYNLRRPEGGTKMPGDYFQGVVQDFRLGGGGGGGNSDPWFEEAWVAMGSGDKGAI